MNLIKIITDRLRRKPLLVKPVVSTRNCNTCANLRQNQYAKYRHEQHICDLGRNYIVNIQSFTCNSYMERDYGC